MLCCLIKYSSVIHFCLQIYDIDSKSPDLNKHDFIGWLEMTLGELVTQRVVKRLIKFHNLNLDRGFLIVGAEELSSNKEEVEMQFVAHGLDKKSWFWKSNPFLVISKSTENGQYFVVHQTEVVKNNLNPVWNAFCIPVRNLCNSDYDRTLKLECYDWARSGNHDLIGQAYTSLRKLLDATIPMKMTCCHPEKIVSQSTAIDNFND